MGWVAWRHGPPPLVPGQVCTLEWSSGGDAGAPVRIEYWGGRAWVAVVDTHNSGAHSWLVPSGIAGALTMRISAKLEALTHSIQIPVAH